MTTFEADAEAVTRLAREQHAYAREKGFYDSHDRLVELLMDHPEDDGALLLLEHYRTTWALARLMLITTEVAEAAEAIRKGDAKNLAEELGDVGIRLGDTSVSMGVNLGSAMVSKMRKNAERPHMHGKRA